MKEKRAIAMIKDNPRFFFQYAKSKSEVRTAVGPFLIEDDIVVEPIDKCNILQSQYCSVYSSTGYKADIISKIIQKPGARGLDNVQFSEEDVCKAIATIPAKSAPGPDGIPAVLLRNCSNALAKPLHILWSKSMETGKIPSKLKHGLITPIYKGGDKSIPANYRPVTLTSHIVKVFEKIVVKRLTDYMDSLNLFNQHQHGFRKGRSCLSQLLEHYQRILNGLEEQGSVDVVYLDFCKAFDKVDHKELLEKLQVI